MAYYGMENIYCHPKCVICNWPEQMMKTRGNGEKYCEDRVKPTISCLEKRDIGGYNKSACPRGMVTHSMDDT